MDLSSLGGGCLIGTSHRHWNRTLRVVGSYCLTAHEIFIETGRMHGLAITKHIVSEMNLQSN
ncbi:hypothetical protein [Paenibacillus sp. yr247]|uniref:hypothetical protein n=1 Tax=Paenibacillus sp. yr247 TaxID=1761880 RepID=UPI00114033C6|nr:hypothetical protein [Paenibacillus sp. yr247]